MQFKSHDQLNLEISEEISRQMERHLVSVHRSYVSDIELDADQSMKSSIAES